MTRTCIDCQRAALLNYTVCATHLDLLLRAAYARPETKPPEWVRRSREGKGLARDLSGANR